MQMRMPLEVDLCAAPEEDHASADLEKLEIHCRKLVEDAVANSRNGDSEWKPATIYSDSILSTAILQQLVAAAKPNLSYLLAIAVASGAGAVVITAIKEWGATVRGRRYVIRVGDIQVDCAQTSAEQCQELLKMALEAKLSLDNEAIRGMLHSPDKR